jgi:hypothetical protein
MNIPIVTNPNKYYYGKIYQIYCHTTQKRYIGSTCDTLDRRMRGHKDDYNAYNNKKEYSGYCTSYEILKNNNYGIALIEDYPCNNKIELICRESQYIKTNECVNQIVPYRTVEEKKEYGRESSKIYRSRHPEKIKQYNQSYTKTDGYKRYKEKNKEVMKKWQEQKVKCVCGSIMRADSYCKHIKSKKHMEYISVNDTSNMKKYEHVN